MMDQGQKQRVKQQAETVNTHFPKDQPTLGSPQDQDISCESNTAYPLLEGNEGFLRTTLARVDVNVGFVVLSGEDVIFTDGKAIGANGALLERGLDAPGRGEGMSVYADVLGNGGVCGDGRAAYGRDELLGEHDGGPTGSGRIRGARVCVL